MNDANSLNEALDRLMSLSNANTDLVYARATLKRLLDNHSLDKKSEKKLRDFVFSLEGITGLLYRGNKAENFWDRRRKRLSNQPVH